MGLNQMATAAAGGVGFGAGEHSRLDLCLLVCLIIVLQVRLLVVASLTLSSELWFFYFCLVHARSTSVPRSLFIDFHRNELLWACRQCITTIVCTV